MEKENAMPPIMIVKKGSDCFIEPPHTGARNKDIVTFSAVNFHDLEFTVIINFPGSDPFVEANQITLNERERIAHRTIKVEDGIYPFSAFCSCGEIKTFAKGGSFGELIVGP